MPNGRSNFTMTEVKAGAMVLAGIAVFAGFMVAATGNWKADDSPRYYVRFKDTLGLNKGALVRFGGAKVGRVEGIALDSENPELVRVDFRVQPGIPINEECLAYAGQASLTAEKHLEITTGLRDAPRRPPGSEIPVREGGLLDQATDLAVTVRDALEDVIELLGVEETEDEELVSLADILGNVDETVVEGKGLVQDVRDVVGDSRENLAAILEKVEEIEESVHTLVSDLSDLVTDNRENVDASLVKVRETMERVSSLAEELDGVADTLDSTLTNAESLSGDARDLVRDGRPAIEDMIMDLRETVRHLKAFSRTIAEEPEAIVRGAQPRGRLTD
ncbi:MAG: MCE family protein [bacterium]|nr:MCE family protein [bacterium]